MDSWNYSAFLNEALIQIKDEFNQQGREGEFYMWFNLEYVESKEFKIIASVMTSFMQKEFKNRGYIDMVENKIFELCGQNIKLEIIVNPQRKKSENNAKNESSNLFSNTSSVAAPAKKAAPEKVPHSQLNPRYTFDNFVKGDNNAFALNGSIAISRNPGKAYNPVLIYGGVGLGKTHLMQAIGNEIYKNSDAKIIFVTAEDFTNEFLQALYSNSTQKFKNKYRQADVLLIDDIHFFLGKTETQEELFNTFEALYNSNKQMVFTCDRPAKELKGMSERLRSRMERGLNVDLQVPQYETRLAILQKKAENENLNVEQEVLELIAKNISTNVRDLESALTTIQAYEELMGQHVTLEIAQKQLRNMISTAKDGSITVETIQKVIADKFGISVNDIKGKSRSQNVVIPRHYAIYIAKELTDYSLTELGNEFGGRDHTTIMNSINKIEEQKKTDPTTEPYIEMLIRNIKDYKNK